MPTAPLRMLVLVAHPDDAEFHCGGLMTVYRELGHEVKIVTLTNGESGHHETTGPALVGARRAEAAAAAKVIGAVSEVWDFPDGRLLPTLDVRERVIREIRTFKPDLVLTHRNNDYHPDHRAVGDVVRDASYMVTVPAVVPDAPALRKDPVVAFVPDRFTKPYPLQPDVVVDVTKQFDRIVEMLACHKSQMFEWLPYNQNELDEVPLGEAGRRHWLRDKYVDRMRPQLERYRHEVLSTYGPELAKKIDWVEVYEISEYAAPLTSDKRAPLFPFVP
ncbi:MAG: PIG-L deacetylase family protein [Pirellulales bacterium]